MSDRGYGAFNEGTMGDSDAPYINKGEIMAQQSNITASDIQNRFGYHKADETTGPLHQAVRGEFVAIASTLNELLPDGRAKSVAFTELENAAMWANKAIAEMAPVVFE